MWVADLADGSVVGGPSVNFLDIDRPILKLTILNTDIFVKDCSQYYMVFHAVAMVGEQGRVEAIEIGGITKDKEYCGVNLTRHGVKESMVYTAANFPYHASLKPGR